MESLIIQLVTGAVGGTAAGGLMKNLPLGTIGNAIAGIVGGGIGGQVLEMLGVGGAAAAGEAANGLNASAIISSVAGGAVGGGGLMAIVGTLKNMFAK